MYSLYSVWCMRYEIIVKYRLCVLELVLRKLRLRSRSRKPTPACMESVRHRFRLRLRQFLELWFRLRLQGSESEPQSTNYIKTLDLVCDPEEKKLVFYAIPSLCNQQAHPVRIQDVSQILLPVGILKVNIPVIIKQYSFPEPGQHSYNSRFLPEVLGLIGIGYSVECSVHSVQWNWENFEKGQVQVEWQSNKLKD